MKINSIIDLVKDLDTSRQTKNLNKLLIRILLHLQVEFSIYLLPALPAQWKEGSVNGIIARGGFELDLSWKNGKVSRLVVKSRNGGNCRLRSLNPLAGKGLRTAKGENPNKLYAIPEILQPIINKEAKLNKVELKKTYLYDLETKAGEEYIFLGK